MYRSEYEALIHIMEHIWLKTPHDVKNKGKKERSTYTMHTSYSPTFNEANGWSGPSKLQWKAAKSSSGKMWLPENQIEKVRTKTTPTSTSVTVTSLMLRYNPAGPLLLHPMR